MKDKELTKYKWTEKDWIDYLEGEWTSETPVKDWRQDDTLQCLWMVRAAVTQSDWVNVGNSPKYFESLHQKIMKKCQYGVTSVPTISADPPPSPAPHKT